MSQRDNRPGNNSVKPTALCVVAYLGGYVPTENQLDFTGMTGHTANAMSELTIPEDALRALLKQALIEALEKRRDLLQDVVSEALEEIALAEDIFHY